MHKIFLYKIIAKRDSYYIKVFNNFLLYMGHSMSTDLEAPTQPPSIFIQLIHNIHVGIR